MNGIDKIIGRIQTNTQSEIDGILKAARSEAEQIELRSKAQAENEKIALRDRSEKAAAEREERLVSVAQMEARQVSLSAKQEMVEKAYALALEKLCSMPEDQYTEVVAQLLLEAAPEGRGEVIFNDEDARRIGEAAVALANEKRQGTLTLSRETRPIRGGFILKNGNVEVNGTFETLVRLQRGQTAGAVAKTLFPEE